MQAQPIIPWMGGKRRLAKHLLPLFPEHQCYVELFAGGAALFFMRPTPAKVEVINDINGELINLYRVVAAHLDEFVKQFDWLLSSRETFSRLQQQDVASLTDIQRAARFFYLQHNAFGGKAVGQNYGTATTAKAWSANRILGKLQAAKARLEGVYIEREHWLSCAKRYDRPHTFIYADPPYWQTAGYGQDFGWKQYEELAEFMGSCKSKMMLSINDHPDIRERFKDFTFHPLKIDYIVGGVDNKKTSSELAICNY